MHSKYKSRYLALSRLVICGKANVPPVMLIRRFYSSAVLNIANNALTKPIPLQSPCNFTKDTVDLDYVMYKNYRRGGSQPPVIVLHGLLSSKNGWISMCEAIHQTTGREVLNVDARNHGSSPHCPRNTYIDMAYDTVKLIRTLNLPKVTLLGHSMGGRTAMVLSLLYPELVSSLMVVDISPVSMSPQLTTNFPRVLDVINSIDFEGVAIVEEAISFAKGQMHASGIIQDDVVNFILRNVGVRKDKTIGWVANVEVLREYFPTLLKFPYLPGKMYSGPTLFVRAEKSDFFPPNDLPCIREYYPLAQLKNALNVGHNVQDEDPSTLLKFATEFLLKDI